MLRPPVQNYHHPYPYILPLPLPLILTLPVTLTPGGNLLLSQNWLRSLPDHIGNITVGGLGLRVRVRVSLLDHVENSHCWRPYPYHVGRPIPIMLEAPSLSFWRPCPYPCPWPRGGPGLPLGGPGLPLGDSGCVVIVVDMAVSGAAQGWVDGS